jgi:hypothetical protein
MIKLGEPPYLECSSQGDKRFSAFYARPKSLHGYSIEQAYQGMKVLADGRTNLGWKGSKGLRAVNQEACVEAYKRWWREWVDQEGLLPILKAASGLSDIFGQEGHVCQAEVLWEIRGEQICQT